jgi:hypothetical protein
MSAVARPVVNRREYQLEQENAELRIIVKVLRHDLADVRATAELWRKLHEDATRRLMELEQRRTAVQLFGST